MPTLIANSGRPQNVNRGTEVLPSPAPHSVVNEAFCGAHEAFLKQSRLTLSRAKAHKGARNAYQDFRPHLIAVAAAGFLTLISSSLAAARESKAATFSERFAPVLKPQ
jgi:hypothetical protein